MQDLKPVHTENFSDAFHSKEIKLLLSFILDTEFKILQRD